MRLVNVAQECKQIAEDADFASLHSAERIGRAVREGRAMAVWGRRKAWLASLVAAVLLYGLLRFRPLGPTRGNEAPVSAAPGSGVCQCAPLSPGPPPSPLLLSWPCAEEGGAALNGTVPSALRLLRHSALPASFACPHHWHLTFRFQLTGLPTNRTVFPVLIRSAVQNGKYREALRATWARAEGWEAGFLGAEPLFVFLLGEGDEAEQRAVELESHRFGDVVQASFLDNYHNLTKQTLGRLGWLATSGLRFDWALFVDDDAFVSKRRLGAVLRSLECPAGEGGAPWCLAGHLVTGGSLIRDPTHKNYVSEAVYPRTSYPVYPTGLSFAMSREAAAELFLASFLVPAFVWDDVYLGLVMECLGRQLVALPSWLALDGLEHLEGRSVDRLAAADERNVYLGSDEKREAKWTRVTRMTKPTTWKFPLAEPASLAHSGKNASGDWTRALCPGRSLAGAKERVGGGEWEAMELRGARKALLGALVAATFLYGLLLPRLPQRPSTASGVLQPPNHSAHSPIRHLLTTTTQGPPHALVSIDDGNCSMPVLDPWDAEVRVHLRAAAGPPDCGAKGPVDGLVLFDRASGTLRLGGAVHAALGRPDCAARCLRRQDDSPLRWAAWLPVRPNATLPRPCPFFHIRCTVPGLHSNLSSSNKLVFNRVMDNLQASAEALGRQARGWGRPDVVILGLDSTSLSNARRYAPRLLAFLEERFGAVVFRHHSVIGPNTRPNLFPLLTGRYVKELETVLPNDLPLIWRNFSDTGYVTSFIEDMIDWPVFSMGSGFTSAPTDAYWRPVLVAANEAAKHMGYGPCVGKEPKLELMLDFLGRFLRLHDEGPAFGFLWSKELTHGESRGLAAAEAPLLKFLEEHRERLEQAFLVVMGDHGNRRDPIRETEVGRKEAMLPLLALSVPKWARDRLRPVLQENAGRLTSHMDTFVTLADILGGGWAKATAQTGWRGVAPHGGHSLLRPLPPDRSCRDAGVPADFCLCGQSAHLAALNTSADAVQRAARALVQRINHRLQGSVSKNCAELSLSSVRSGRLVEGPGEGGGGSSGRTTLVVVAEAAPSGGLFEATVAVPASPDQPPVLLGPALRVNNYGNQSHCEPELEIRPYCFCKT